MDWGNEPTLGIRWFDRANGNPCSRGQATWLVIPTLLNDSTLDTLLPSDENKKQRG